MTPADLTMIFALRLHDRNPWVLSRLTLISEYYQPAPRVIVLDHGSEPRFADQLQTLCRDKGLSYFCSGDEGLFSPAVARNRAFEKTRSELLFFCDIDCVGAPDLFAQLASIATALEMRRVIDTPLILPVYHMAESDTEEFSLIHDRGGRAEYLNRFAYRAQRLDFDRQANFFIAPYSNIFLINRKLFELAGGYDERFVGHGSEDFEFLTRLALLTRQVPVPRDLAEDCYGPLSPTYFGAKPYRGFRRFLEAMAAPSESMGLRVFHLYHDRTVRTEWVANNDWKRKRLNEAFGTYLPNQHRLLEADWLQRSKTMVCLCKHHDQWGYFLPFRSAGYRLLPFFDDSAATVSTVRQLILDRSIDAISIFNPYMSSHAKLKPLIMLAREKGLQVTVIERGALPSTIYYADDVSYVSDQFTTRNFEQADISPTELASAADYMKDLHSGSSTLESQKPIDEISPAVQAALDLNCRKIFIPLQLREDMACTMFRNSDFLYPEFEAQIECVADAHPSVLFIIKPHPLADEFAIPNKPNIVVAQQQDNVHALIDQTDATICYNSGVGLLALIHLKPLVTIGNAFYNIGGVGIHAHDLREALEKFAAGLQNPARRQVERLVAWFLFHKYSTFVAQDDVKKVGSRRAHNYKNIAVTDFRYAGQHCDLSRFSNGATAGMKSYLSAKFAMAAPATSTPVAVHLRRKKLLAPAVKMLGNEADLKKYNEAPAVWFAKLRNPLYRITGRLVFGQPRQTG